MMLKLIEGIIDTYNHFTDAELNRAEEYRQLSKKIDKLGQPVVKDAYSCEEAGVYLGVTTAQVHHLIRKGYLEAYPLKRDNAQKLFIKRECLEAYQASMLEFQRSRLKARLEVLPDLGDVA